MSEISFKDFFDILKKAQELHDACDRGDASSVQAMLRDTTFTPDHLFQILQKLPHCSDDVLRAIWDHHDGDVSFFLDLCTQALNKSCAHILGWVVPLMPRTPGLSGQLRVGAESAVYYHNDPMIEVFDQLIQSPDKYSEFMRVAAYSGHVDLIHRWLPLVDCHHPYVTYLSSAAENDKTDAVRILAPLCTIKEVHEALRHAWNNDNTAISEILFDALRSDPLELERAERAAHRFLKKYKVPSPAADRFIQLFDSRITHAVLTQEVLEDEVDAPSSRPRKI